MTEVISFLGVAMSQGQNKDGVQEASQYFRKKQFDSLFKRGSLEFKDLGDIREQNYEMLHQKCFEVLKRKDDLSLFVGGDHSMGFSTISAFSRVYPKKCVLWVDAHPDMNTPETSPSGNIHGMPLAGLLGLFKASQAYPQQFSWFCPPYLSFDEVVLVGIRSVDSGEREFLNTYNIPCIYYEDMKQGDFIERLREIFQKINPEKNPLHLSFDVDGVDPVLAPATGTPAREGLNLTDVNNLMSFLREEQKLVSMDMTEFNPSLAKSQEEKDSTYGVFEQAIKTYFQIK